MEYYFCLQCGDMHYWEDGCPGGINDHEKPQTRPSHMYECDKHGTTFDDECYRCAREES